MKAILKLEELAFLLLSAYVLYYLEAAWWWYLLLFIGPDVSMLGYLAGNIAGAICYNVFHHKAIALILIASGFILPLRELLLAGIAVLGHSSMDRMLGYGLKQFTGFTFTHLGPIGK